jgi:hypothetical protein
MIHVWEKPLANIMASLQIRSSKFDQYNISSVAKPFSSDDKGNIINSNTNSSPCPAPLNHGGTTFKRRGKHDKLMMVNSLNMDINNSTDTNYVSGKQAITFQLNSLNTNNHDYDVRNPGPVLAHRKLLIKKKL